MSKIDDALEKIYSNDKKREKSDILTEAGMNDLAGINKQMQGIRRTKFTASPTERARQYAELNKKKKMLIKQQIVQKRLQKAQLAKIAQTPKPV